MAPVVEVRCKRCGSGGYARNGVVRGHQRYHLTDTPARGKPPAMKAWAVLLYGMCGISFSMIGRVLGVSGVAVLKWMRAEAAAMPEPEVEAAVVTVKVDEMWHFLRRSWRGL